MQYLIKILAIFLVSLGGFGGQAQATDSLVLDLNDFFCTHVTSYFPKNGIMIPSATRHSDGSLIDQTKQPSGRITLHWCAFGLVAPHDGNDTTQAKYGIFEIGREVLSRFVAGYFEDLFMVGPHRLSSKSFTLVPQNEVADLLKNNPGYQGKFIPYDSQQHSLYQAGEQFIQDHNLNAKALKLLPARTRVKITPQDLLKIKCLMATHNKSLADFKIIKENGDLYVDEEAHPHDQVISVSGRQVKAKDYLLPALAKDFMWAPHSETYFSQFEQVMNGLFFPVASLAKGKFALAENKKFLSYRPDLVETAKSFVSLYTKMRALKFQSTYKEDEPLFKDFMTKWTHNIQKWYGLVQLQSKEMLTKPFEGTPYGNQQVLSKKVEDIGKEIKVFTVDPFVTLPSPNEETQKIEERVKDINLSQ